MKVYRIKIFGLVQGVGFRPFIYRIATRAGIKGTVENRNDGVIIEVNGTDELIESFVKSIKAEAPPASMIDNVEVETLDIIEEFPDFRIVKSTSVSDSVTEISPDIAVCDDCLKDLSTQEHRINYPFINCTNCGPRFSIIRDLPYDRDKTTMQPFVMCEVCKKEYTDILDRRFHAQPVACNSCGPQYALAEGETEITGLDEIIQHTANRINSGEIVAVKGIGGFFLACNALNEQAVQMLRLRKNREGKPFAVMFRSIDDAQNYVSINDEEKKLLLSWRRPVVLLNNENELAPSVSNGLHRTGIMMPYLPFHYLLFEKLKTCVVVMTSGNISSEPIIINNEEAKQKLAPISDAILTYNRDIFNRCDDSVTYVLNGKSRIIRRSRGYVPNPVRLSFNVDGILACGSELKNTFCIGKDRQAILSQHIGDLKNLETYEFYEETIKRFERMFRFVPDTIACDLHPDYLSSKYAEHTGKPLVKIQHHHAHIASCMAENKIDETVLGVAFDGVGLGDDGQVWGGEFLICDYTNYERYTHFDYVPMPGGDLASEEPWRMGLSYLYKTFGKNFIPGNFEFLNNISESKISLTLQAIEKKINCPLTSACGRLFDAVAAISGICADQSYEAQAPMMLEAAIDNACNDKYSFNYSDVIDFMPMIEEIVQDVNNRCDKGIIAVKFHNTIIASVIEVALRCKSERNINKIALSGGSFQNWYLLEKTENLLKQHGFEVLSHSLVPSNDGGIALGQLAIAAKRRQEKHL
jgi:hydrogenase maturation protein HypF